MAQIDTEADMRPPQDRINRLQALAEWRREWVQQRLAQDPPFHPRGEGSDYNIHFVDIEADDDEFHRRAREIMGIKRPEEITDEDALLFGAEVDGAISDSERQIITSLVERLQEVRERARAGDDETRARTQMDRNQLKRWWTRDPEGLARWATKPHPWTSLYRQLRKYMPAWRAKRVASEWFHEVFGIWPGHRKGRNPIGPG